MDQDKLHVLLEYKAGLVLVNHSKLALNSEIFKTFFVPFVDKSFFSYTRNGVAFPVIR